jgi:hypothetical protein
MTMASAKMRIALGDKDFKYFARTDFTDVTDQGLLMKIQHSGPMTRRTALAELARRSGAEVARRR